MDAKQTRQGVLLALAAYFIWGIAPAYFKLIYYVPADEILTHRVIWSFFFMVVLMSICRQWSYLKTLIQTPQKIFMLAVSAVLIGGNWLLFIWAVNNHHMLEASLGYFINPLVNIVLGMIFLGERFRRMQWLAVILAVPLVIRAPATAPADAARRSGHRHQPSTSSSRLKVACSPSAKRPRRDSRRFSRCEKAL